MHGKLVTVSRLPPAPSVRRIGFLRTCDRGGRAPVGSPLGQKTGWVPPDLASVAVIGGSGLYSLFEPTTATPHTVATPYGDVDVTLGTLGGRAVAFLPRHGAGHSVPPHRIPYRANIWALRSIGVCAIISTAAVGAVDPAYPVGSLCAPDQYLDRTNGRADTFYDEDSVQHLPSAEPFCPQLLGIASSVAGRQLLTPATIAVIQGPRFSTRAESVALQAAGAHLVNMTLYPEVPLAAELGIGTVTLAYVTDNDAAPALEPLSAELVFHRLAEAQLRIIGMIEAIAAAIPDDYQARQLISVDAVAIVLSRATR